MLTTRTATNLRGEGNEANMRSVSITGVGMTPMNTRDSQPARLAGLAVTHALADADIHPRDVGLVFVGNAMGGRLNNQGCIRGQSWLRGIGLVNAGIVNVDNSCAGGSTALHTGWLAALGGESPVLVVGVEKMWVGDRAITLAGIADALPYDERVLFEEKLKGKSIFMHQNAAWVNHQLTERGTTIEEIASTTVKSRRLGSFNPLAQLRSEVTEDEVLQSGQVAGALTRLMCSSFTDGAAAAVLSGDRTIGKPRIVASVMRSGTGELEYHDRMRAVAREAEEAAGMGPDEVDVVELHDATSGEELFALESLDFFSPGEAGKAAQIGVTSPGGKGVCVNPSGGLVSRGHPLGATGLCQLYEVVCQLRGRAGARQSDQARVAMTVNTGGIISGDAALASVHMVSTNV